MENITISEDEVADADDETLNRIVAEWLGELMRLCPDCHATGELYSGDVCSRCDGSGKTEIPPDYTSRDGIAWRLLERMPPAYALRPDGKVFRDTYFGNPDIPDLVVSPPKDPNRALVEAAAILAINGVEPG